MSRIAVVVPLFNESSGITETLDAVNRELVGIPVIFVDDGSTDNTLQVLKPHIDRELHEVLALENNSGYGLACYKGARHAFSRGFEWVIFIDSDLTNPLEDVLGMISAIRENNDLQYVKGDRFSDLKSLRNVEPKRRIFTTVARFVSLPCFRFFVSDPTNGFRAIRRDVFPKTEPSSPDFSSILEELYFVYKMRARCLNFPTNLYARTSTRRKTSFSYTPNQIWNYLRWCLRAFFSLR